MTDRNISSETLGEDGSRRNTKNQSASRLSISSQKSERKVGDSSSTTRRESRRLSRLSETITVISDCGTVPDTCVLCGSGIPFAKCLGCDNEAHERCIEAFFCTTGKKVRLDHWRCPKCVTLSHMNQENRGEKEIEMDESKANQVDLLLDSTIVNTDCLFCKMDMDPKNCKCRDCVGWLDRCSKMQQTQKYPRAHGGKAQMLKYNKCLQYRDFTKKSYYQYLEEEDRFEEKEDEEEEEGVEDGIMVRICWSIAWLLLFITFAFPIALISSVIFIIMYCFDACCSSCHPVCCFFLEGIKLPGTCCRGICSGDPMCPTNDDSKRGKC